MPPRGYAAYGRGYPGRGGQGDPYRQQQALRLVLILLQQIASMERKPPVTLLLLLANVLFYVRPAGLEFVPSNREGCLHPARVLKSWQCWRLLWSPLLHADELHLFYNMSSLLWKGGHLEPRLGSLPFLRLVVELGLVSNLLYVGLAAALASWWPLLGRRLMGQCAVGFSGVLFGLKVVLNHNSPGWTDVYGVRLPTKYLCWAELVLNQVMVPEASFWGHLCGILAGLLHVWVLRRHGPFAPGATAPGGGRRHGGGGGAAAAARLWRVLFGVAGAGSGRAGARTYGHGTWGGGSSGAGGYADQALHELSGPAAGHQPPLEEAPRGCDSGAFAGASEGWGPIEGPSSSSSRSSRGVGGRLGGEESASPSRQPRQRSGGRLGSAVVSATAVVVYAVMVTAWMTNPSMEGFLSFARRELGAQGGASRLPGSVQQALLWAQAKTGLGVTHLDLYLLSLVGVHEKWFLGAFGSWAPVPPFVGAAVTGAGAALNWATWAVQRSAGDYWCVVTELLARPPPGVLALQAAMAAIYLAWQLLPPSLMLSYFETGLGPPPGVGVGALGSQGKAALLASYVLSALSHDRVLPLARSCLFVALAGSLVEQSLGPGWMVAAFLVAGAAVHVATDVARLLSPGRRERRSLYGRKGADPGLYALMLLALAQQAQRVLAAAQAAGHSSRGGGGDGSLAGWLAGLLPAGLALGPAWTVLGWPVVRSMLSVAASMGSEPEGPSAVVVAALWLAVDHIFMTGPAARRRRQGLTPSDSRANGVGTSAQHRRSRLAGLLWWPVSLLLWLALALLQLVAGLALAPFRAQLAVLGWARRWGWTLSYLALLAGLVMTDIALVSLQHAMPSVQEQAYFVALRLACVGTAMLLLALSFARHMWRQP